MMQFQQVGGAPVGTSPGVVNTPAVVYPTFQSAATTIKPDEYTAGGRTLGHYRTQVVMASLVAIAAGGVLFAVRNNDQSALVTVKRITIDYAVTAALTAAVLDVEALGVTGWSTAGYTTNATSVTGTTVPHTGKARNSMGPSALFANGNVQFASNAAGMTTTTSTIDSVAFGGGAMDFNTTVVGTAKRVVVYDTTQLGQHPLVYGQQEGFIIRNITVLGGTGAVKAYLNMDWMESVAF